MVEAMIEGPVRTGVALPRPPGHHARPDRAMGFCLLNNVAVAAAHARAMGVERVAIVDFDVHHGNGTQEMFYADPAVLYTSLHQFPFQPGFCIGNFLPDFPFNLVFRAAFFELQLNSCKLCAASQAHQVLHCLVMPAHLWEGSVERKAEGVQC